MASGHNELISTIQREREKESEWTGNRYKQPQPARFEESSWTIFCSVTFPHDLSPLSLFPDVAHCLLRH